MMIKSFLKKYKWQDHKSLLKPNIPADSITSPVWEV